MDDGKIKFREPHKSSIMNEGFVAQSLKPIDLMNAPLESWTQTYHKPYQCDMAEATVKAIARKAQDGDDLTEEWEKNGRKSYWLKYSKESTNVRKARKEMLENDAIGIKKTNDKRGDKGMDNYLYTMYTDKSSRKTYVTVQDENTEKYIANKEEVLRIANKYYFKTKADKLTVQWGWIVKDTLYLEDPKMRYARKVYCATRV